MNSPLHLLVVDGKKITNTATLPVAKDGQPVHIKAVDGAKYLLSSGDNQPAPDHVVVKRVGNDLHMFTQDGDETPELIIDGFYQHTGELSGMAADGSYHVYVNEEGSDRDAFLLLDNNGASTLVLAENTSGLEGLAAGAGLSNTAIGLAALAALLAGGIALLRPHHSSEHTPAVPEPGVAHDRVGTVQGIIAEHGVTNDNRPLLTGFATRNSVLRVYADGKLIGSTVVGPDGHWQMVPDAPLADGSHDLTFSASYGDRESAQSRPINFVVDTTPPAAPLVDIVDGKEQDLSHGGLTNNGNIDMSGHGGEPGDVVKLYDGDKLVGSAIVGADGSWSVPIKLIGDGEHDLSASYTDPAGNEGPHSPLAPVELDTTPPPAPVGTITDGKDQDLTHGGLTNNGDIDMSGNGGAPGDVVKLYDGDKLIGSAIVGADGSWTVPAELVGDGEHDLSASYTDPAGNEGPRSPLAPIELDTTPPDAPVISELTDGKDQDLLADDLTNNGNLVVKGTGGTQDDIVKLYDGDTLVGSAIVGADGSWTIPTDISGDGVHDLSASYTDPAGNESLHSAPAPVDLDTTPPDAPVIDKLTDGKDQDLLADDLTNNGNLVVSGSGGTKDDIVKLYDGDTLVGSAIVGADGSWTVPTDISGDGVHDLSASYTDPAGNESLHSAPAPVDLDTTPPDAPVISGLTDGKGQNLIADGLTNNGNLVVKGSGGVHNDVVRLYDGATLVGSAIVGSDGSWSIPTNLSSDGDHNLNANYTDPAGNVGPHSSPVVVDLDTTAPTTTLVLDDNAPSLSGVTEPNAIVKIYEGSTVIGSQQADINGKWSFKPTGTLADGTYHYSATAQDKLGNTSGHTANLDFKVATTVNDFDDGTAQGWVITGAHASDTYFNGSGVTLSPGGAMAAGDIMYREFVVQAGHTYNFSFSAVHWYSVGSSTIGTIGVGLNIDGSSLGNPSTIYNGTINYSWTATTSGVVKIALYTDDTNFLPTNWANFDNFTIRDAGPTGATSVSSFGVQSHEEAPVQHDDSISSLSVPHDDSSAAQHDTVANHFQQSGNELKLIDNSPVIDLANVARQHQGEEIHTLSLEGHGNNVLNVNINDVLAIGSEDLFQQNGAKQLMIKGDKGDVVNLESVNGAHAPEQWNAQGAVTHDGTTYNVYHNADREVDVLIQQGIQTHLQ